jgi:Uma2 family endonuclease
MNSIVTQTNQPENNAMALQPKSESEGICMTEEEYLASEPYSEVRREYIDGRAYAMDGSKRNHNILSGNISREFGNHLKGSPCAIFSADIKVALGKNYVYPDVIVDCANAEGDGYFAISPVIIVEVLSKSTKKMDTTTKLIHYINLPTLKEYVLVEQDSVCVQVLRKRNYWQSEYFYLGDNVTFESIGLTLTVEEIYDRVDNDDMNEFRQHMLLSQE